MSEFRFRFTEPGSCTVKQTSEQAGNASRSSFWCAARLSLLSKSCARLITDIVNLVQNGTVAIHHDTHHLVSERE